MEERFLFILLEYCSSYQVTRFNIILSNELKLSIVHERIIMQNIQKNSGLSERRMGVDNIKVTEKIVRGRIRNYLSKFIC